MATLLLLASLAGNAQKKPAVTNSMASNKSILQNNPVVAPWKGAYGGVPPLDKINIKDFIPAMDAAMAENLDEINKITADTNKPSFDNTIAALERAGRALERATTIYGIWSSNMNTDNFKPVSEEIDPKLAAFEDKVIQNTALFKRIQAVYNDSVNAPLTPEQKRLTWRYYMDFVHHGARLDEKSKTDVAAINQQLATLYNQFNQNLLADEEDIFIELKNKTDLAGLPQNFIDAAAAEAVRRKIPGSWIISNTRSSIDPFLTYSSRRDLREKAWRMFTSRGDNGNDHDNNKIIKQVLLLRAQRAGLFGFPTHAHWKLEDVMAKTPERALALMEAVWKPAVARVHEEVADMQDLANKENAGITIEPWDYHFYAEKVRKAKYDVDQEQVKNYLQLDKIREGVFWVAGQLFDFNFTPVKDVPVFHPDVTVYKVTNKTTGNLIGLWYFDPYARPGKESGAWENEYRMQERFDKDVPTIVSNNSNFIKGKAGEPILISWDDANTIFHEFGHALHALCSNVNYPKLSGTNVATDYVEFPSQLLEKWLLTPEVLSKFALHYKTGKPIPQDLVDKINKASTFNKGYETVEYLASALVDMKIHLEGSKEVDPDDFERKTLAAYGMPKEMVMRHRLPQFGHIFSDDNYSAGYYSYIWSQVLRADAYEAFIEAGGPYDKEVAKRLYEKVLSVGGTVDESEAYRNFRGRDPKIDALMKENGFPMQQKK